jgi:hypothetical protein
MIIKLFYVKQVDVFLISFVGYSCFSYFINYFLGIDIIKVTNLRIFKIKLL